MRIKAGTPRAPGSPASSAAIDARTLAHLAFIIVTWGSNYPLTKLALRDMGPLTFSAVRLMGGAVVLAFVIVLVSRDSLWPAPGERVRIALSGILQYAGVLGFAALGLLLLPAGRTSVAVYSMPLWAAVFALLLRGERLAISQWIGVALGAAGLSLFLDPAVLAEGIAFSVLIFGETVPLAFGASSVLVIGGALLVMKRRGNGVK